MAGPFSREDLRSRGFSGFVPFDMDAVAIAPEEPGVYVILREDDARPVFLEVNPGGHFKGKDPTVPVAELEAGWVPRSHCIYIGKADVGKRGTRHIAKRLREFRRFGDGEPVGHQGGKRIWQIADADTFIVAWKPTPDQVPEDVETDLIDEFFAHYGQLPIGNRKSGRRSP